MAKNNKKYPLKNLGLGLGLDQLSIWEAKKILQKAKENYEKKLEGAPSPGDLFLPEIPFDQEEPQEASYTDGLVRNLRNLFLEDEESFIDNLYFHPILIYRRKLKAIEQSLKKLECATYLKKLLPTGFADELFESLISEEKNGVQFLLRDRKKYQEIVSEAKKAQSERHRKIILIIKSPYPKDLRVMIYDAFVKDLDHERFTELRLKKWENKWPYDSPLQEENLENILQNATLTALSKVIEKYESKLLEDLEEILLVIFNELTETKVEDLKTNIEQPLK